jgi:shikimate kinase
VGHHNPPPATVLIGLRGSGKTTLGRLLAARRGVPFIDLDDRTVAGSGHASVSAFFRSAGEPAFRAAESLALQAVLAAPEGAVIALGGGTPTAPGAQEALGARLAAAPGDRPLLMGTDFAQEAALLGERRLPLYRSIADAVVTTAGDAEASLAAIEAVTPS